MTLTLGGPEATVSNEAVSLAQEGIEVGGSTTVPLSSMVQTVTTVVTESVATGSATGSASATSASATAASGAAAKCEMALAGLAGVAGLAAFLL